MKAALPIGMLLFCCTSYAADALLRELASLRDREGVEVVNARLSANWETESARLGRLTEACNPNALALSISLLDSTNAEALGGHTYSLGVAVGICPAKVLAILPASHIAGVCSTDAFAQAHPNGNLFKEIERRRRALRRSPASRHTVAGEACAAAYDREEHELRGSGWSTNLYPGRPEK